MNAGQGGARRDPIPWPDSPFLRAVRRAGHDRFFALALCRADVKRQTPNAYTAEAAMAEGSPKAAGLRPADRRPRSHQS